MTSLLRTNPKGTGLLLGLTDMEKPTIERATAECIEAALIGSVHYNSRYDVLIRQWQSSIVWHEVRKEDEEVFRDLAGKVYIKKEGVKPMGSALFSKAMAEGIEIPEGIVKVKYGRKYLRLMKDDKGKHLSGGHYVSYKYPYIKPIKKEEETQEDELQKLEEKTITNMGIVSDFMEHCKEKGLVIPDKYFESYFNA